ncbi:MAG: C-GCAxxG-C-C family protein [Chrysiogenia bacterium]
MKTEPTPYPGTKKLFWKLGACSTTLFHILNREFGHALGAEGSAAIPLAGGIMRQGHQCGALWGAALAAGAESFRRCSDRGQAVALAVAATQGLVDSFTERTGTVSCREITRCNWNNPFSVVKYMVSGGVPLCFNLVDKWAPEAFATAEEALAGAATNSLPAAASSSQEISCATEVASRMGAGDEEAITVAGFAGGLGLSGDGCGALAAAIWVKSLAWCREKPKNRNLSNPYAKKLMKVFKSESGGEMLCQKICDQRFKTAAEHSEFMKSGGCGKLIDVLARA